MRRDECLCAGRDEGRLSGEHLVRHHAERVDVGTMIDVRVGHGLFGRHVDRCAKGDADRREPAGMSLHAAYAEGLGDPEVGDDRVAIGEQYVVRLDVAMHDAFTVRERQGIGDVAQDACTVFDGHCGIAVDARPQRFPTDEGHHIKEHIPYRPGVQHGHDVRMLQPCDKLHFTTETIGADPHREFGGEHLDDHLPVEREFGRQEDPRHAAAAQFTVDAVLRREAAGQLSEQVGLWRSEIVGLLLLGLPHLEFVGHAHSAGVIARRDRRRLVGEKYALLFVSASEVEGAARHSAVEPTVAAFLAIPAKRSGGGAGDPRSVGTDQEIESFCNHL